MREGSDTEVPHEVRDGNDASRRPSAGIGRILGCVIAAVALGARRGARNRAQRRGRGRPRPVTRGNRPASSISTGTTDLNDEVAQTMARVGGGELNFLPTPRIRFAGTLRIPCWHSQEWSANLELLERR